MSDEEHGGLGGIEEAAEEADFCAEMEHDRMLEAWGKVKQAMAGTLVHCPVCDSRFRKLTATHAFCRRKGRGNCKDRFWNTVNDERRERAVMFDKRG